MAKNSVFENKKINKGKKIIYLDKRDFTKKTRSLKTYCPKSYKDFIYVMLNELDVELTDGRYSKDIFTSDEFKNIYGQIKIIYSIKNNKIVVEDLEPSQFLFEGYMRKLDTYKGIYYRDEKDKFKIDFMLSLKK